ncbi:MAG: hypothetical protein WKF75_05935 [Singulisphaera sp.]
MPVPVYGGLPLFGNQCTVVTVDRPRAWSDSSTFGLSSQPGLDGGARGRVTTINGVLRGVSALGLAVAFEDLRQFNDGISRTFRDSNGQEWPQVQLEPVHPVGRIFRGSDGSVSQQFRVRLLHLV